MALELKKKDEIIKNLQERLRAKDVTNNAESLAWDMLKEGVISGGGGLSSAGGGLSSGGLSSGGGNTAAGRGARTMSTAVGKSKSVGVSADKLARIRQVMHTQACTYMIMHAYVFYFTLWL